MPLAGTTTLRETSLASRIYNLEYFVLVASANSTNTLRPYIAATTPAPGSSGAGLIAPVTLTIANRQTTVNATTIRFFTNSVAVGSGVVSNVNAAGVLVTYTTLANRIANATYTNTVIYADNSGVSFTNSWTFVTGTTGGLNGTGVWSGLGGTNNMNWASATNWTGGTPGPGFNAIFASPGATTSLVTNNIVSTNVAILGLYFNTNNSGFQTTWIQDGVTLSITNLATATGPVLQVGGGVNSDNIFNLPTTNTISGANGTLYISGNPQSSGLVDALNFQIRQEALPAAPNQTTLNLSGLGTMSATVGKFYVAQGGTGAGQAGVSGCVFLARTNFIACLRTGNAGQFEVGDSSGGTTTLPGSSLYLGITNAFFADTMNFGRQKATNNLVCFNPNFTNGTTPVVYIRGTNSIPSATSLLTSWTIGDAYTEATFPVYVSANVDFSGGRLDALVNTLVVARGATTASDSGFAAGTLTMTAGTLNVLSLTNGIQRANNTATETGIINVNGTATLASTNIILAQSFAGATASLVTGTLNVTNGTVRGNLVAGGGISTVNINGGLLIVSNAAGTVAAPLSALNFTGGTLQLNVNGSSPAAQVNASSVAAAGTKITIASVANVTTTPVTIHLITYGGSDPFAGLTLNALPAGYSGHLVDNAGSIDLSIMAAALHPPTIRQIVINGGGQLVISGTNNSGSGGTYHVLTATNLLTPLTNWTILTNGSFDASGNFSSTNSTGTNSQRFYLLSEP